MEKDRSSKIIAIVGLIIAVMALSIGFAAYSQTLTISSTARYNPEDTTLDVYFTSDETTTGSTSVSGIITPSTGDVLPTAFDATLSGTDSGYTTISGLSATFTDKGQSVTYNFYVHNASDYVAYLKGVTFANASGGSSNKLCTPGTETTASMVTASCDDINISLNVHSTDFTSSQTLLTGKSIAVSEYVPITITIEYDASKTSTIPVPDGDFTVLFGDITLSYSSAQ